MEKTCKSPPGGETYKLSTECLPNPEGGVQGLAVLSDDFFVTGSDDNFCTIWGRIPGTREFASMQTVVDSQGMIRSMLPIPAGLTPALPTGGFATASLDKRVRLYSFDPAKRQVALVRTLDGHLAGVISLSLTVRGELVSGGWEGHARVWNMETGACLATLEGHENGTRVAGLSDGSIAVGSTGRKNEFNQHVDYKVRIWAYAAGGYSLKKVISDHEQAVQDVDPVQDVGFLTASNDGSVKIRGMDGAVLDTFSCPMNEAEGKPWSVFKARMLPSSLIAACCEDAKLRLYSDSGLADTISLPGTPWCAAGLSNGDIVVVGNQAGTSRKGHAYVFTKEASRYCTDMEAARYMKDCEPPSKGKEPAGGVGGGGEDMQISGPYENRSSIVGSQDGQMGFFSRSDGSVFLCTWSVAAGTWMDVGTVTDSPGNDDDMGAGGGGAGTGASSGAGAGASGKSWDYVRGVTMDTSRGMRSMQLCWNEEDDPITVAKNFVGHNGVSEDAYEEVKNFIIEAKMAEGESVRAKKKAAAMAAGAAYVHFPAKQYFDFSSGDLAKLSSKLWENNAALTAAGAACALTEGEEVAVKEVVTVLTDTRKYHATSVPRAGAGLILSKLLTWPADRALPAVDLARMLMVHPDGAEAVGQAGKETLLPALLGYIKAARVAGKEVELRPVALVATRALFNAFRYAGSRSLLSSSMAQEAVLEGAADVVGHDHPTVRAAGTVLLYNYACMVSMAAREAARVPSPMAGVSASGANPSAAVSVDHARVQQALALAVEALSNTKDDVGALLNTMAAVGTLCVADKAIAGYAKGMELPKAVAAAAAVLPKPESVQAVDAATEARKAQLKAVHEAATELADMFKKAA